MRERERERERARERERENASTASSTRGVARRARALSIARSLSLRRREFLPSRDDSRKRARTPGFLFLNARAGTHESTQSGALSARSFAAQSARDARFERPRARSLSKLPPCVSYDISPLAVRAYIYIHTHVYQERERERGRVGVNEEPRRRGGVDDPRWEMRAAAAAAVAA